MRPLSFVAGISIGIVCSSAIALAWTGPTGTAPANNVDAPINTGASAQLKSGNLGVNGLAVFGDTLLQSGAYLNWGATTGSPGYGIHDNAGVLEFKNAGGIWASFNATIQAFFSGGNSVAQVKFADGTVQTTAASSGGPTVKAMVVFSAVGGTVSVRASYNVTSVTRTSVGHYIVNFASPMLSMSYAVVITNAYMDAGRSAQAYGWTKDTAYSYTDPVSNGTKTTDLA